MKNPIRQVQGIRICILCALLIATLELQGRGPDSTCDDDIELQVVTDRISYESGTTMRVKLVITNTGKTPLYLFRGIGECTSQYGWLSVKIRDLQGNDVGPLGCAIDLVPTAASDVVEALSNTRSGILLEEGEIYGREQHYVLPKRKGTYRVYAELTPPGFLTEEQKAALAEHHMRVLRSTCLASPVTITLK